MEISISGPTLVLCIIGFCIFGYEICYYYWSKAIKRNNEAHKKEILSCSNPSALDVNDDYGDIGEKFEKTIAGAKDITSEEIKRLRENVTFKKE